MQYRFKHSNLVLREIKPKRDLGILLIQTNISTISKIQTIQTFIFVILSTN